MAQKIKFKADHSTTKPDPHAPTARWETYNKTISDLQAQLSSAPIKAQQKASETTIGAQAKASAKDEAQLHETTKSFDTTYAPQLNALEQYYQ